MSELYYETSLSHHGIKGQKWGVRRFQDIRGRLTSRGRKRIEEEKAYRDKLTAISKNKSINGNERERIKYRNKSLPVRFAKMGVRVAAHHVLSNYIQGKTKSYKYMDKKHLRREVAKEVSKVLLETSIDVAYADKTAKMTADRYTDSGKRKGKQKILYKEDYVDMMTTAAVPIVYAGLFVGKHKLKDTMKNQAENKRVFDSWGDRILNEKVQNVVWQSDDLSEAIIDNYKPSKKFKKF